MLEVRPAAKAQNSVPIRVTELVVSPAFRSVLRLRGWHGASGPVGLYRSKRGMRSVLLIGLLFVYALHWLKEWIAVHKVLLIVA